MKKVLILGVASVQMEAIEELKQMGIYTYACAQADDGPGSKLADHFEIINILDQEKLSRFVQEQGVDCVYSVGSDLAMPVASRISEQLRLPRFVSSEIAATCNNKNKLREFLGSEFEGNVPFQIIEDSGDEIALAYPFIMKPSDSQGQRGVRLIRNDQEFKQHYEACRQHSRSGLVIIEEYVDGPEISVNAYIVDGDAAFMVPSDREVWPQFQGGLIHKHIVPSAALNHESEANLKDLVLRTSRKLGVQNGPLYFQIKMRGAQPYIIEVTPRLDGCHMWNLLKHYTGVNLIKLTFEHLLFGKTDELHKYELSGRGYTLEFLCEVPEVKADYSKFTVPSAALHRFNYYHDGDWIRPINGQYEKIGYFVL